MGGKLASRTGIPRDEVPSLVGKFIEVSLPRYRLTGLTYRIAGSYRRGCPTCGDIDVVFVFDEERDRFLFNMDMIQAHGRLKTRMAPKMNVVVDGVQFDVHLTPRSQLGSMLLHSTGSWQFNKFVRTMAKMSGFCLNQYGLFEAAGKHLVLESPSEDAFFDHLSLSRIPPEHRSKGCTSLISNAGRVDELTLTETGYKLVNRG